jgi:hypothetical protein
MIKNLRLTGVICARDEHKNEPTTQLPGLWKHIVWKVLSKLEKIITFVL